MENFYEILGVPEDASTETIKKAYFEKAKLCHPDATKNSLDIAEANKRFIEISRAYNALKSPESRRKHDLSLVKQRKELNRYVKNLSQLPEAPAGGSPPPPGPPNLSRPISSSRVKQRSSPTIPRVRKLDQATVSQDTFQSAELLLRAGQFEEAAEKLRWILSLDDSFIEAMCTLTVLLAQLKTHLPEAQRWARKAIKLEPANPRHYVNLAMVYEAAGQINKAREEYLNALREDPGYADAQRALSRLEAKGPARPQPKEKPEAAG